MDTALILEECRSDTGMILAGSVRYQPLIISGCCIDRELIGFGTDLGPNLDLSWYLLWSCVGTNPVPQSQGRERPTSAGTRKCGVAPAPDLHLFVTPTLRQLTVFE
jgi:hypothetical protein